MWAPKMGAALAVTAALLVVCPSLATAAAPVARQDAPPTPTTAADGGGGGDDDGALPTDDAGGARPPPRTPASDQCLTPEEWRGSTPSALPGYRSCFRHTPAADGTATLSMANVPNHPVDGLNPNSLCYIARTFTLPVAVKGDTNRRVPARGAIGVAANGVYLFGPEEGGGGNAVSGAGSILVDCAGHPQVSGIWHYHHPDIGCAGATATADTLVGWAFDGFPIYGPLAGTKAEVDAILDDCNGVDVDDATYGYRYHTRTREQVDETLAVNAGANNTDNWAYYLGCYRGVNVITERDGVEDTTVCVSELAGGMVAPTAAPATAAPATAAPATAAPSAAPYAPPQPQGTEAPVWPAPTPTYGRHGGHGGRGRPHRHHGGHPRGGDSYGWGGGYASWAGGRNG